MLEEQQSCQLHTLSCHKLHDLLQETSNAKRAVEAWKDAIWLNPLILENDSQLSKSWMRNILRKWLLIFATTWTLPKKDNLLVKKKKSPIRVKAAGITFTFPNNLKTPIWTCLICFLSNEYYNAVWVILKGWIPNCKA